MSGRNGSHSWLSAGILAGATTIYDYPPMVPRETAGAREDAR